jgi:hypothetical protein
MEVFNVQVQGMALRLNESLLDFRSTVRAAGGLDRDGAEAVRTLLGDRFCSRRWSLGGIGSLDDHKDHKGNDQKIDDVVDEDAVGDLCTANREGQPAEVHAAHDQADDGGQDVGHEGCHDLSKGTADDHAHGEVKHIPAHDKGPEFF